MPGLPAFAEGKPMGVEMETPNREGETQHGFMEHPEKNAAALAWLRMQERISPDTLDKFACLAHMPCYEDIFGPSCV
jgi:hypothetical protein